MTDFKKLARPASYAPRAPSNGRERTGSTALDQASPTPMGRLANAENLVRLMSEDARRQAALRVDADFKASMARPARLSFHIPLRTISGANAREHHHARARRVKKEREAIAWAFPKDLKGACADGQRATVTMIRIGPRYLDSDGAVMAMKGVRDELAKQLGTHDGPDGPVTWEVEQAKGEYGVMVTIRMEGR